MADEKLTLLASLDDMVTQLLSYVRGELEVATKSEQPAAPTVRQTTTQTSPPKIATQKLNDDDDANVFNARRRQKVLGDLTNRQSCSQQTPISKISSKSSGLDSTKNSSAYSPHSEAPRSISRRINSDNFSMLVPDRVYRSKIFSSTPANFCPHLTDAAQDLPLTLKSASTNQDRLSTSNSFRPRSDNSKVTAKPTPNSHHERSKNSLSTCSCCHASGGTSRPLPSPNIHIWSLQSPSPLQTRRRERMTIRSDSTSGVSSERRLQRNTSEPSPSCSCHLHSSCRTPSDHCFYCTTQQSTFV